MKVLLGMSGGVDSSVAAVLLREQGHDVTGVFLHLWSEEGIPDARENACCSIESMEVARRVAAALDLPLYVFNVRDLFRAEIVDPWLDATFAGETPNPCLSCNRRVKIGHLLQRADELGFDAVATGHYARTKHGASGWELLRGIDASKDQSYFLSRLEGAQLARTLFPLGSLLKRDVVAMANAHRLPLTAARKESQDLSFISDDVPSFLRRNAPSQLVPGPIRDIDGRTYPQQHEGLALYTIGQRRGLPISGTRTPKFVVERHDGTNTLVVGDEPALFRRACRVRELVLRGAAAQMDEFPCQVQIRSRGEAVAAVVRIEGARTASVAFSRPQRAVTPGQHAVFYDDAVCLGAGVIVRDDIE